MITKSLHLSLPVLNERMWAAIGYLGLLCIFSRWKGRDNFFVHHHARYATALFVVDILGFVAILIIDRMSGGMPLIMITAQWCVLLCLVFLSMIGSVKALFGDYWSFPAFVGRARRHFSSMF